MNRHRDKAVIDGRNAAYLQAPRERRPIIRNILKVAEAVQASGLDPIIVFDPSIRSLVASVDDLEALLSDLRVIAVPEGKEISPFVLETAERLNAFVVSNNTYAEYWDDYSWIENRRIPVAIVNGAVLLLDKTKKAS
jgi:hypothetical protein